jgi:hypothetical protein
VCLRLVSTPVSAAMPASGAITAFTAKQSSPLPGETIAFEIGVTSSDGTTWDPATVSATVSLTTTGNNVLQTSAPVAPATPVVPGETTALFVPLTIATRNTGTYSAVATITHGGNAVAVSTAVAIVVGAVRAQTPAKGAPKKKLALTLASNSTAGGPPSEAISAQASGTYAGGRSISTKAAVSTVNGGSQPVISFQTASTVVRAGTYAPNFDNLVLSGVTGTGFTIRRQIAGAASLQFEMLSSGHATPNPFTLDGLTFGIPVGAGTLGFTTGFARQEGPPDTSLNSFLESGDLYGIDYVHPANDAGFSYEFRSSLINFYDGIAKTRRTDRAYEALSGFNFAKAAWTVDVIHTGPFYPTLSAPSLTADKEDELLTGTRTFGAFTAKVRVEGTKDGLDGTPSTQRDHVWNEGVNLGYTLHNDDAIELDVSNAINHVFAETSVESLTQDLAASYTGKRGFTSFEADFGTATDQDNSGMTTHTITDAVSLGRAVAQGLSISGRYALTEILANAGTASSISPQGSVKMTYTYRAFALSLGYNRSAQLPFAGVTLPASLGLSAGLAYKPKQVPFTVQGSYTQNHGSRSGTIARLNVSRKY